MACMPAMCRKYSRPCVTRHREEGKSAAHETLIQYVTATAIARDLVPVHLHTYMQNSLNAVLPRSRLVHDESSHYNFRLLLPSLFLCRSPRAHAKIHA